MNTKRVSLKISNEDDIASGETAYKIAAIKGYELLFLSNILYEIKNIKQAENESIKLCTVKTNAKK